MKEHKKKIKDKKLFGGDLEWNGMINELSFYGVMKIRVNNFSRKRKSENEDGGGEVKFVAGLFAPQGFRKRIFGGDTSSRCFLYIYFMYNLQTGL